jgi:hypothetical protein
MSVSKAIAEGARYRPYHWLVLLTNWQNVRRALRRTRIRTAA